MIMTLPQELATFDPVMPTARVMPTLQRGALSSATSVIDTWVGNVGVR